MIFQLSLFLDLRDISGQTHCFCFGTREIVVIILFTSASLFLYDGLQVRLHLRSGNTGKTYKTYMFIYSLAQKKKKRCIVDLKNKSIKEEEMSQFCILFIIIFVYNCISNQY